MKGKIHTCILAAVVAVPFVAHSLVAEERVRVSGGGGVPLTSSVTSMWGAVDEPAVTGKKPLSFMVYFRGAENWHARKWTSKQEWYSDPFLIEFACDLTVLRVEVDRVSRKLTLFGHEVDLAKANVILVDHVDQPGSEHVVLLGLVDLVTPEDSNPAAWVLQQNQEVASAVLRTNE